MKRMIGHKRPLGNSRNLLFLAGIVLILGLTACKKKSPAAVDVDVVPSDTPVPAATAVTNPSFATDVYTAILSPSCTSAACHDAIGPAGGLDMSSVAVAYANLAGVVPTDSGCTTAFRVDKVGANPTNSLLVKLLESSCGASSRMPNGGGALSAVSIQTIKNWISQGALNN